MSDAQKNQSSSTATAASPLSKVPLEIIPNIGKFLPIKDLVAFMQTAKLQEREIIKGDSDGWRQRLKDEIGPNVEELIGADAKETPYTAYVRHIKIIQNLLQQSKYLNDIPALAAWFTDPEHKYYYYKNLIKAKDFVRLVPSLYKLILLYSESPAPAYQEQIMGLFFNSPDIFTNVSYSVEELNHFCTILGKYKEQAIKLIFSDTAIFGKVIFSPIGEASNLQRFCDFFPTYEEKAIEFVLSNRDLFAQVIASPKYGLEIFCLTFPQYEEKARQAYSIFKTAPSSP